MNIKSKTILRVLVILLLANIGGGSCIIRAHTKTKGTAALKGSGKYLDVSQVE